jgi:hypothetical protein
LGWKVRLLMESLRECCHRIHFDRRHGELPKMA